MGVLTLGAGLGRGGAPGQFLHTRPLPVPIWDHFSRPPPPGRLCFTGILEGLMDARCQEPCHPARTLEGAGGGKQGENTSQQGQSLSPRAGWLLGSWPPTLGLFPLPFPQLTQELGNVMFLSIHSSQALSSAGVPCGYPAGG